jgi:hypothetical protein
VPGLPLPRAEDVTNAEEYVSFFDLVGSDGSTAPKAYSALKEGTVNNTIS